MTIADAGADVGHRVVDDVRRGPRRLDAGTVVEEALQHRLPVCGVHHLGVPLEPEQVAVGALEGGDLGTGRRAGHREPGRCDHDRVPVRHPHRLLRGLPGEQHRVRLDGGGGAPVLGALGALHRAAEGLGHRLEAVADPEGGHAGVEQRGVDVGRTVGVDAGGTTGEDHRRRALGEHLGHGHRVGDDLAVDVRLAHAAGDELGVLRPEVHDEDGSRVRRITDTLTHAFRSWRLRRRAAGPRSLLGGVPASRALTHPSRLHGPIRHRVVRRPGRSPRSSSSTAERPVRWIHAAAERGKRDHGQSDAEREAFRGDPEGRRGRLGRAGGAGARRGDRCPADRPASPT